MNQIIAAHDKLYKEISRIILQSGNHQTFTLRGATQRAFLGDTRHTAATTVLKSPSSYDISHKH